MSVVPILTLLAAIAPSNTPVDPEEIVVTGERVPRSLRETPSSVVVFTHDAIEAQSGADRVDQLLASTPNVQLGSGGQGPTIRGQDTTGVLVDLPAFLGGTRPRVTLQVDGRAVGYSEFVSGVAPLWDVKQVEVFRSPQTTTQGRNSIAGAIFVRTNDPAYEWEARERIIIGNFDTLQESAVATGPIVDDQLAFRLATDFRRSRASSRMADHLAGADPNRERYGLVRFKLLAEPKAVPGLRLETSYTHSESKAPGFEPVSAPFRKRADPLFGSAVFATNVDSLTARLDQVLSESLNVATTLSYGDSHIRRFAPPGLGETRSHVRDFSVESIVDWRPAKWLRLISGIHYLQARLDQQINLTAVIGHGEFRDRQHSLGLFGDATVDLMTDLTLTAGLRYQRDRQDRQGALGSGGFVLPIDFDETFDAWLPKVSIAYDVTEAATVGAMIQRAYNPGGTALNFDTGEEDVFGEETLWSYELFARARLGARARLSANLFYNAFQDAQRAQTRAFTVPGGATAFWAEIENAPKARSYGLEAELDWDPTGRLHIRAGLGLLRTKITRAIEPDNPTNGKEFQRSPAMTASLAIDWRPVDRLRLSGQARHHSDYFSDDINTPQFEIGPATVIDARAAYDVGPVRLFAYARNLLDDFHMTLLIRPNFGTANDPREIGAGIEARF